MADPLDPSAAHDHHVGLDLHDHHHHGMEKFELPNLDEVAHFPDFDDDDFGVPDMKQGALHANGDHHNGHHHHGLDGGGAEMNGGAMAPPAKAASVDATGVPSRATMDRSDQSPVEMDGDAAAEAVASGSHAGTTGTNLYDAQWSAEEQAVLERGMETYGADEYKSLWRYIKIAATLPAKGVRDVALRMRWMSRRAGKNGDGARGSKRKGVANGGGGGDGDAGGKGGGGGKGKKKGSTKPPSVFSVGLTSPKGVMNGHHGAANGVANGQHHHAQHHSHLNGGYAQQTPMRQPPADAGGGRMSTGYGHMVDHMGNVVQTPGGGMMMQSPVPTGMNTARYSENVGPPRSMTNAIIGGGGGAGSHGGSAGTRVNNHGAMGGSMMSAGAYGMSGGGNGMNVGYMSAPVVYDGVYGHQTAGGGMVQQHGGVMRQGAWGGPSQDGGGVGYVAFNPSGGVGMHPPPHHGGMVMVDPSGAQLVHYPQMQINQLEEHGGPGRVTGALGDLLAENVDLVSQIRGNMDAMKPPRGNLELLARFRDNLMAAKEHLAREDGASQMPPLPVDIDHQLANQILPAPDTTVRVGVKQAAATAGKCPAKGAKGANGVGGGGGRGGRGDRGGRSGRDGRGGRGKS